MQPTDFVGGGHPSEVLKEGHFSATVSVVLSAIVLAGTIALAFTLPTHTTSPSQVETHQQG